MSKVVGIDAATRTGMVTLTTGTKRRPNTESFQTFHSKLKGIDRADEIARQVSDYVGSDCPDLVVLEGYAYAGPRLRVALEIGTLIRWYLWRMDQPYIEVAPTTLKKFVTGKGRLAKGKAGKAQLADKIRTNWGFDADGDWDIADAYGLAAIGLAARGDLKCFEAHQIAIISEIPADSVVKLSGKGPIR